MWRSQDKFTIDESTMAFLKLESNHKFNLDCTDRKGKDSQNLQKFIEKRALKNQDAHLGMTYLVTYKKKIIGYITVSASNINKNEIFKKTRPSTRDGALFPALAILDFCIDKELRGKAFGEYVLEWCNGLARTISKKIGCRYIILFTKDPDAIEFYKKHTFQIAEENNKNEFKLMYLDLFPELK